MLTINLAIFLKFLKLKKKKVYTPDYQDSENLRSQEEKNGVDLKLDNGHCERGHLIHSNISLNQLLFSLNSHFHFCLLMLPESIPSVLCHGNTCRWRPCSSLPASPVMKRPLITAQGEECNLQDTHEQFKWEGGPWSTLFSQVFNLFSHTPGEGKANKELFFLCCLHFITYLPKTALSKFTLTAPRYQSYFSSMSQGHNSGEGALCLLSFSNISKSLRIWGEVQCRPLDAGAKIYDMPAFWAFAHPPAFLKRLLFKDVFSHITSVSYSCHP